MEMILPEQKTTPVAAGRSICIFLRIAPIFQKWTSCFGMNSGDDDGTRTRDLCRDSSPSEKTPTDNE
jgi:hypothetical protein